MSARVPVGPLADLVGGRPASVLLDLGCTPSATNRYLQRGIPVGAAEVLAEAAGLEVRQVWPAWDDVLAEADERERDRRAGLNDLLARARRAPRSWELAQ